MKKRLPALLALLLILAIPAYAVFNERNFAKTLSILRSELHQEHAKMAAMESRLSQSNDAQHKRLVEMTKKCNELALILYSQNQDYTFDMTYALEEVTRQYEDFNKQRMPFDQIVDRLNLEIERYEHLAEALRRLPPVREKLDAVPDSLSAVMDTILVHESHHHHEGFDITGTVDTVDLEEHFHSHSHFDGDEHDHMHHNSVTERASEAILDAFRHQEETGDNFYLDAQSQEDRDSCLAYTLNLLDMYSEFRDNIVMDNDHYEGMRNRLAESYEYARNRYRLIQKRIFIDGQDNYFKVIRSFPRYVRQAVQDTRRKYGIGDNSADAVALRQSDWRGPVVIRFISFIVFYILLATLISNLVVRLLRKRVERFKSEAYRQRSPLITLLSGVVIFAVTVMIASVSLSQNFFKVASGLLLIYAWLLAAILVSLLIRIPAAHIRQVAKIYIPVALLGLLVIIFRIIFIPNRLVNLIFPPIILGFTIWQYVLCLRIRNKKEARGDVLYCWISFGVMLATLVASWMGYVLLAVQIFIWWLFQLTAIETITALYVLLDLYEKRKIKERRLEYKKTHTVFDPNRKDSFIAVTWLFDFIKQACLPILMILSIPFCLWMASGVFDLTEICKEIFYKPFFNLVDKNGNAILHLSLYKLVLVSALFFLFRYISYLLKAVYRKARYEKLMAKEGKTYVHANEINFTLSDNIIGILVWGSYIAMAIVLLKIPMGALSIVAAGLATGLGLAMKDILNNFIYGIQLMSGRLRVGDIIECDGIRGKVNSISYQTTQIQTVEDTLIAFTNTTLFNKNFKNLTRSSAYEYIKVGVGVSYGTDMDKLREVLSEASKSLLTKDKYGRNVVDPKRGITVAFDEFGDSSVNVALKQYVLVEERYTFIAKAKELIYKTLNENGIEIPYPQRDIHIKSTVQ
ncbi:MAG: mechanosensitive ion channel [Bacteroidales bacterium]|nr:mechanosensitive ion channel [Bacteroidales bacterium]